ncbi:hypothetical protein B0H15DRAFT_1027028 [Mycena belliarum]|uniref:Uncharacterized protein n=1 Tax=Mycena belliarum TaxID=1033014 RepID=A0AAD6TRF4_9AGAR|nr:hypothetical protein B0H15DRAFT_1027028 [Mycena belliae]
MPPSHCDSNMPERKSSKHQQAYTKGNGADRSADPMSNRELETHRSTSCEEDTLAAQGYNAFILSGLIRERTRDEEMGAQPYKRPFWHRTKSFFCLA